VGTIEPSDHLPSRMVELGYLRRSINGVDVIIPPVCNVLGGEFLMGSNRKLDPQAFAPEMPQHHVVLPAYQIGTFQVTVAEYACFVRATSHVLPITDGLVDWKSQLERLDHPVVCVTWEDAMDYVGWLAKLTSEPWRLPSEAEWEKAARWDSSTCTARVYPWGDVFDETRCNVSVSAGVDLGTTNPVGTYLSGVSPYGVHDMTGNVWEWTSSLYSPYPTPNLMEWLKRRFSPNLYSFDKDEVADILENNRMLRGGSFFTIPSRAHPAFRAFSGWVGEASDPDMINRSADAGFRLARSVASEELGV
jgi:toxoflavin biosynthesis protein ToxD